MMSTIVQSFKDITQEHHTSAGGKGGTLARLYQAGFSVPDGFVILPDAFNFDDLTRDAWLEVRAQLERLRNGKHKTAFAVRSSALSEDSLQASFAGEFDTVLDVHTDAMIREAIQTVRLSGQSDRVQAYTQAKGMDSGHDVAVVVQTLVRADISLGDELVSGEIEPYIFSFQCPKGYYEGPPDIKRYARRLYKLGVKLERELGSPQDIEWCIAGGKLYLLQSRPITTLVGYDPQTGMWNSSLTGDYLWMGHEVFPDVMTPSSWSIWRKFQQFNMGGIAGIGNIGGRLYINYSLIRTLMLTFGRSEKDTLDQMTLTAGAVPEGVKIPPAPISKLGLIKEWIPIAKELLPRQFKLKRKYQEIINTVPERCQAFRRKIQEIEDKGKLITFWNDELYPYFDDFLQLQDTANEDYFNPFFALKKKLTGLVGDDEAKAILSTISAGSGELASMGNLVGLDKLSRGEISREEYSLLAGHRPEKENELAEPRLYEDPDWIDKQLADYETAPINYQAMIENRAAEFETTWSNLEKDYPKKAKDLNKKIDKIMHAMFKREVIRSELTRVFGVLRMWFLRSGELTGIGDDIFFLSFEEVQQLLVGDDCAIQLIPARKETFNKLNALPAYPLFINGRFDPFEWAQDPRRRGDVFDSHAALPMPESDAVTGFPGSAGRVEGSVRLISSPKDGHQLEQGEILVASTTNVGWTPLFPKAAAVITDIGAPLSHAAIVARELGIPAVVGCGNATMRLRTGDKVLVDGGHGIVEILEAS
jgi:pyruvate,water dikinase